MSVTGKGLMIRDEGWMVKDKGWNIHLALFQEKCNAQMHGLWSFRDWMQRSSMILKFSPDISLWILFRFLTGVRQLPRHAPYRKWRAKSPWSPEIEPVCQLVTRESENANTQADCEGSRQAGCKLDVNQKKPIRDPKAPQKDHPKDIRKTFGRAFSNDRHLWHPSKGCPWSSESARS